MDNNDDLKIIKREEASEDSSQKAYTEAQLAQESAVGIAAYVSPNAPGFACTIKQRYTDFLVNEISTNGEVLHLTDTSAKNSGKGRKRQREESDGTDLKRVAERGSTAATANGQAKAQDVSGGGGGESPQKRQRVDNASGSVVDGRAGEVDVTSVANDEKPRKERKTEIVDAFPEADKSHLCSVFGDETTSQILDLHASTVLHPERKPRDHAAIMSQPITEKSKRTEAHVAIRKIFAGRLETVTLQDQPGIISIKAASTKAPEGARGKLDIDGAVQKGKLGWNDLGGEYLHFTLYKENKDTMEALHYLASQLRVRPNMFQFPGTKDRRAVTVQRVAIFRVRAEQVANLNKQARGWRVGNFSYEKHGLDLGDSAGNEFVLTLRDFRFQGDEGLSNAEKFQLGKSVIEKAGRSFQEKGFLNYYGLQRFGTYSTGTHLIGQKMLQDDLKGAIDLILTYDPALLPEKQEDDSSAKVPRDDIARADTIRKWRETGLYNSHDKSMPRRFQAESSVMEYLSKKDRKTGKFLQDRDWQGALMTITRNLRLMYVHAYQSYVWNAAAGKRWQLHGDEVVEGDLVIVGDKDENEQDKEATVDEDGEPIFHPAADDTAPAPDDVFTRARPLSKAEAASGKYSIFDVVLPLPGYDVEYPADATGKFYEEFMASAAGGGLDPHNMRRAWKDASLSGAYREMMAKPGPEFSMELRAYRTEDEQLVETDLEAMQKGEHASSGATQADGSTRIYPPGQRPAEPEQKLAIVLKMQLGSSQYATMALRELTKGGAINYKPDYSAR